jgi:hypothetical protein
MCSPMTVMTPCPTIRKSTGTSLAPLLQSCHHVLRQRTTDLQQIERVPLVREGFNLLSRYGTSPPVGHRGGEPRPDWQSSLAQFLQLNYKTPGLALTIAEDNIVCFSVRASPGQGKYHAVGATGKFGQSSVSNCDKHLADVVET